MEVHKNLYSWNSIWKNEFAKTRAIRACVSAWFTYQRACVPTRQKGANFTFLVTKCTIQHANVLT